MQQRPALAVGGTGSARQFVLATRVDDNDNKYYYY